jgi:diguanylate cyclase (GGDEF)-like protein
MSEDRGAVHVDAPHASETGQRRNGAAFRAYTYTLLTVGTIGVAAMWWHTPVVWNVRLLWILPALVVGFLLAEQLAINIDVRGGVSWTISLTEVQMVVGLLVAPFQVVLVAHVVAGVGTLLARRVHDRAAYNAGVMLIEVDSAFLVAQLVNSALSGKVAWAGAFTGALAVPFTSTLFAVFALRLLGQRMRAGSAVRLIGRVLAVGLLNASVGVTAYELVQHSPWGWALVALVVVGMSGLYLAYNGLLREQRDLEVLSDVSLMVARSGQRTAQPAVSGDVAATVIDPAEWQVITERIREQLGAKRVVLRLWPDPRQDVRTLVAGDPLPSRSRNRSVRDDPMLRLAGAGVRQFRHASATDEVVDALTMRGTHEALVVPLRGANQVLGVLEAHDRASRWRGFGRADVQLIGTLASHLATAVDNRRLMARLRHDAYHDPLTGLLNRAGFRETAGALLRAHPEATVVRLDVDVLAAVSDALGYAWSDRMVVAAGRRLRELIGADVPLARLESGTFATLLIDHSDETLELEANRLHSGLTTPYQVDRLSVEAGVTVGYVRADAGAEDDDVEPDVDELLRRSDMAVRAARGNGEHVRAYSPSMGQVFLRRFELVTQFRQALASGQVQVHYQPKVALPSRQVLGVEALVRWSHPEYGRLAPDEFVPAVEATGLIDALTSFVTECALTKVKKWLDRGIRMSAAVNLSVRNLDDQTFPDRVAEALARYDVPAELLTFELTESGVMSDPAKALPVLRRLHAMGVVLAVDDFGTGYSSLAYLRRLPVDEVKIDKSFVLGMGSDLGDLAVVRSIVELGHSLGLTVVAEGVEDVEARDALVTMGCHVAQGYLISRPLPEDRLEAWLSARTVSGPGLRNETVLTLVP